MTDFDPNKIDPRLLNRGIERFGRSAVNASINGPVAMPMAMPGPGGGPYNRYREMTLEEMLLENRVIFLVGEINHISAARVYMQMLYLESNKRDADISLYINSPGGVVDDLILCRPTRYRFGYSRGWVEGPLEERSQKEMPAMWAEIHVTAAVDEKGKPFTLHLKESLT